jgi:hypothetical protein
VTYSRSTGTFTSEVRPVAVELQATGGRQTITPWHGEAHTPSRFKPDENGTRLNASTNRTSKT